MGDAMPSEDFLEVRRDDRGALIAVEFAALPFAPARVFVVNAVPPGTVRGGHGPAQGRQLLINLGGRIDIITEARGAARTFLATDRPGVCAMLEAGDVAWQRYGENHLGLLVICDTPFDPGNYVEGLRPPGEEEWLLCKP